MNIAVFCGASLPHNTRFVDAARELGRTIAEGGHTLVYGGSNLGLMGVLSGEALRCGGRVVGVIPTLFSEDIIRSQAVTELVRVGSMAERKEYIIRHSDAFVALPGGIGTLDEVSEVMVANQLQHLGKPMVLLNFDGFYDPFLSQLRVMHDDGFVRKGAETALHTVASVDELFAFLHECPRIDH
ncbi:MAG: TIGR00730 family Rossman fold protein [Bacteroidales bacterium]|nr:TIGR00730 family Rossman fold protein [Bacteroidales bacterium]